jgi:integrase
MASIAKDPATRDGKRVGWLYRILFKGPDGKRRALRLGGVSRQYAERTKLRVHSLLTAKRHNEALDDATSNWLADLDDDFRDTLAAVGLIDPPVRTLLGPFMADYIDKRKTLLKPGSLLIERQAELSMIGFFGATKRLRDITEGDAEDFRNHLLTVGGPAKAVEGTAIKKRTPLAEATVRKRCSIAGKIMRYAMRHGLINSNPFEHVKRSNVATEHRAYIKADDARKVLAELPTTEWKLLFALSRWGGLRVGSEVRRLTWADVDRAQERLLIRSPKTEHHAGHESRWLPIFPELAPLLAQQFAEAAEGELLVLPMLQGRTDAALRGPLERAIKRTGLTAWPRLWHSLRATRQTELENSFPSHVVCAWMGNSASTAAKHYLQVTDDHFREAAQNAAHSPAITNDQQQSPATPHAQETRELQTCGAGENEKLVREGFEPPTKGL